MRYRNLLLAATLLGVVTGTSVYAADLPTKAYTPVAAANWTGFYAGLNAGYGWATATTGGGSSTLNGFVGGGQVGFNWQGASPLVLGVEADFQGSSQRRSDVTLGVTIDQSLPWFGTARGRVGYAVNNWMLYGTGGGAWVDYKVSGTALGVTVSSDATKFAWVAGGGVEWMFAPKWSAKFEYLYVDTGNTTVTLFGVPFNGRAKDNVIRVGGNYHF
ncbi:MAG TPA: outer membrane protein [Pseudolabrys sp.]